MTGLRRWSSAFLLSAALLAAAPAPGAAQEASKADVQWAQTVLKERGLYSGRENGDLNDATRGALREFQRRSGLPATGRLDAATTAKLMEGRQAGATTGNLAAPRDPASRSRPQPEVYARPQAAPTTRVQEEGGEAGGIVGGFSRGAGAAPGSPGSPQAAPRSAVSGEALPSLGGPVQEAPPPGLFVPEWVRTSIAAVVGLTVLAVLGMWWASGRRGRRPPAGREAAAPIRREPSFAGGPELRADPPLRAGGDRRRR
jgi:peptidoglycan hydrolase-like protein with peptidoglycan-binding domain